MISGTTRSHFADYAAKRISFDTFTRKTRTFWAAAARYLLTRWKGPDAVEVDDLVQELLLEAWRSFPLHDPERGDLTEFICYQATSRAKRWLHGQRGRRKCSRSDRAPSRHPLRFSNVRHGGHNINEDDIAQFISDVMGSIEADQELTIERRETTAENVKIVLEAIERRGQTPSQLMLLRAYADAKGDLFTAVEVLTGDFVPEVQVERLAMLRETLEYMLVREVARAIEVRREERLLVERLMENES